MKTPQTTYKPSVIIKPACSGENTGEHFFLGAGSVQAGRALPVPLAITDKDDLLASIEARLTKEVIDLAGVLRDFSGRVQLIGKELPDTAHFSQSVTSLLSLIGLQLAVALLKGSDTPLLLDDGAQYLSELGLSLEDSIRELHLDGRRFLAVALIDSSTDQVANDGKAG